MSFRAPPKSEYDPSEASWFTRNVLESKLLGWGLVAGVAGLPFVVGLVDAITQDPAGTIQGYKDLFATSKFVSASSVDAVVLNIAAAALIPQDLKLRQPEIEDSKARQIGASTLLLPFLGAALYCALRPSLPQKKRITIVSSQNISNESLLIESLVVEVHSPTQYYSFFYLCL